MFSAGVTVPDDTVQYTDTQALMYFDDCDGSSAVSRFLFILGMKIGPMLNSV